MLPADLAAQVAPGARVEPISGSGSNRRYWRVTEPGGRELIATEGLDLRENEAFFYLAGVLAEGGVNVPRVLWISPDRMRYLQTSLGRRSLYECLDNRELIAKAIDLLAQVHEIRGVDWSRCFPVAAMDRRAIMWDLNYFKYCFLKTTPGLEFDEPALEDDFEALTDAILAEPAEVLMLRDFQSRNLMVADDCAALGLIDFQGARRGYAEYDLASFLWQARAGFAAPLRREMTARYCERRGLDFDALWARMPLFVSLRLLQALGAYGFRGRFEGKPQFLAPIPAALSTLVPLLPPSYLKNLLEENLPLFV